MKKLALLGMALIIAASAASAKAPSAKGSAGHKVSAPADHTRAAALYGRGGVRPTGINRLNPQPLPP